MKKLQNLIVLPYINSNLLRNLILLACCTGFLITLCYLNYNLDETPNVKGVRRALHDFVIGQDQVVTHITHDLHRMRDNRTNIFVFTGGVGTGKTFTASLIANTLFRDSVYTTSLEKLPEYCHKVVIIDNLSIEELKNVISFIENSCIKLVILVFDLQKGLEADDETMNNYNEFIRSSLEKAGLLFKFYYFQRLRRQDVVQCIEREIRNRNLPNIDFDSILPTFVDLILENVNYKNYGCKGVHSKVVLFTEDLGHLNSEL